MATEQLENFEQLASRAVACKHWRWMPGMVTTTGVRILRRDDDGYTTGYGPRTSYCVMQVFPDSLPDLSDPATLGCLLALVREAYNAPDAYLMGSVSKQWMVHHFAEPEGYWKPLTKWQHTEAAALVAALDAAP